MMQHLYYAWLYWDPPREVFVIPIIDRPVVWYGLFFVLGFILGYFVLLTMFRRRIHERALLAVDRLTWFIVIGTIVGARLGLVLFYDLEYFLSHPDKIVKIWEGGLASHGGTIGVLISIFLFLRWHRKLLPEFSFVSLLDYIVVPTALVACLIRVGNFFNQEILGYPSDLPWAVIFGHPMEMAAVVPRHPVQLYEGLIYLATFVILYVLWRYKEQRLREGVMTGIFFILVFGSRFLLEFLKLPQGGVLNETYLQTGQYLSIPFIVLGIVLVCWKSIMIKWMRFTGHA